ncbi:RNA 3'-terminal phosphate cyclase [Rubritalea sp.]|uniref:RNA 3'-terminal phosphate cyclase n=1 Tax=Rubritalea sp. TaxID=2109375 RepID=UPI003EF50DD8
MIEIDGKEGGGQVLRSALSLSMVTGQAFQMRNIRGGRKKPGLMRQHLTCVKAAAEIAAASTECAELHSTELEFRPQNVAAGDYTFAIGSAGSTTLVLQTLLPALMLADEASTLRISGGTHNPMAPSADYIVKVFLPAVRRLGIQAKVSCDRVGFAPAGGGILTAEIGPSTLTEASFSERGDLVRREISAMVANLSGEIMLREVAHASKRLAWEGYEQELRQVEDADGSGNCFAIQLDYEHISERFTEYGRHGMSSERVAGRVVKELKEYLSCTEAVVAEHLADQLLLPMALAGKVSFITPKLSNHLKTNIVVIEAFLAVKVEVEQLGGRAIKVSVSS